MISSPLVRALETHIRASGQREGLRRMRDLRQIGYVLEQHRPEGSREWHYRLVSP